MEPEFRLLGPLEVWYQGRQVPLAGARQRELLAILLLHAGRVVSADRLMDALWGERQPAAGATALRVRLSQLRKALGPLGERVATQPPGYVLRAEPDAVDLGCFERMLGEADRALSSGDAARAHEQAEAALGVWRGEPLADFAYAPWAQAAISRLEELRVAAHELRVQADLALGRHGRVVGELQALVDEHPLRERLWGQLMLALYRDGRQADALATYRRARALLVDRLGIEPGPELQTLEARILAQDAGLTAGQAPRSPAPRRAVLAIAGAGAGRATAIAERLAGGARDELILVELVDGPDGLPQAHARLAPFAGRARVAAFTSAAPGADAARLAAEQDASVLLADAPDGEKLDDDLRTLLASCVCDVVLVAGSGANRAGPVLVPFGGHEHEWSAIEVGAWLSGGAPLRLLGVRERGGRDSSRLLASASLALQRGLGVSSEPLLVDPGPDGVVAAASEASAVVMGLSDRWAREGVGRARLEIARRAKCPVLLVRGGLRPSGLAPRHAMTRFTWSGAGA